ncbi:uncharacterized protein [Desmodus rotundus]|uniref:uncharacterized protein isoform X2 n=1 Tax=Desmodus rotundus TaxID=9430 RepID=UPI0023814463|nr:uncharacterized protein LOC123478587 isoform X2 [Desmodus rotundus]
MLYVMLQRTRPHTLWAGHRIRGTGPRTQATGSAGVHRCAWMWTGLNRQVELTSVKVDLASLATITGQVPGTPGTHATTCPQELRHGLEGRGPAPPSCRPLWKLQGQRPSRATSPTPVPGAADIAPLTHWELSSNSREDVPGSDGGEPRSDIGTADCHALWSGGSESVSTTRETATREVQCVTGGRARGIRSAPRGFPRPLAVSPQQIRAVRDPSTLPWLVGPAEPRRPGRGNAERLPHQPRGTARAAAPE